MPPPPCHISGAHAGLRVVGSAVERQGLVACVSFYTRLTRRNVMGNPGALWGVDGWVARGTAEASGERGRPCLFNHPVSLPNPVGCTRQEGGCCTACSAGSS